MSEIIPSFRRTNTSRSIPPVWLRISAFLSLKSPNTQETYRGIINEFCIFLGASSGTEQSAQVLLEVTDMHALAYKEWLEKQPGEIPRLKRNFPYSSNVTEISTIDNFRQREKKTGLESTLSNATINKKLTVLRRMYRLLIGSGLGIYENPFDSDRIPPPPKSAGRKRPTEMVDFDKVNSILQAPDLTSVKGKRDQAILALLFGAGLRRSELINIRMADLRKTSKGNYFIYLRSTKAKRDAEQGLPIWVADILSSWIEQRKADKASPTDFIFPCYSGRGGKTLLNKQMSASGVYKLFKFYTKKANAGDFLSPHSARATAITKLLEDGIPHREVQEFSRHSSIQMVEVYDKRRIGVDQSPALGLNFSNKPKRK